MKIDRVQTGVRLEKRLVSTLNQLAKEDGQNLGEKLEEIVSHAFEGKGACAWSAKSLNRVANTKKAFGLSYDSHASYRFDDANNPIPEMRHGKLLPVQRVQVGFKMEKRMLKVLKAIAEMNDTKLGNLLEEIVLHQMEGADVFYPATINKIRLLQKVYGMDYDAHATYHFQNKTRESIAKRSPHLLPKSIEIIGDR